MTMFHAPIYQARRAALAARLRDAGVRGLVLLPGNVDSPMNYRDNAYEFRQDSSFLYFCGLSQPGLALVLDIEDDGATLYGDDASIDDLVWTGPVPSLAERADAAGLTRHAPAERLPTVLANARAGSRALHFLPPYRGETRLALAAWLGLPDAALDEAASRPLVRAVVALRSVKAPEGDRRDRGRPARHARPPPAGDAQRPARRRRAAGRRRDGGPGARARPAPRLPLHLHQPRARSCTTTTTPCA
jgi:hypothetical protein